MWSDRSPVSTGFCLLIVWFAAANGWRPLLTVLTAAAFHECGHLLALSVCGAHVIGFRVNLWGAALEIDSSRLSYGRELFCVLAGPAANFLCAAALAAAGNPYPALTGANLILCVYNLLPVRPLDGGRALELAVSWAAGPWAGERAARHTSAAGAAVLAGGLGYLMWHSGGSLWLLPAMGAMAVSAVRECFGLEE